MHGAASWHYHVCQTWVYYSKPSWCPVHWNSSPETADGQVQRTMSTCSTLCMGVVPTSPTRGMLSVIHPLVQLIFFDITQVGKWRILEIYIPRLCRILQRFYVQVHARDYRVEGLLKPKDEWRFKAWKGIQLGSEIVFAWYKWNTCNYFIRAWSILINPL